MAIVASNQISIVDVTDGAEGKGVSSVTPEYYLSSSKTTQTGGSWSTTPPTWSSGKYLWVRHIVTYTDSSVSRTEPYCDTSWEAVKEIEIGSRNIATGTANMVIGSGKWGKGHWRKSGTGAIETIDIVDSPVSGVNKGTKLTASEAGKQIGICQDLIPLNNSDIYTLSCWVRGSASGLTCRLQPFYASSTDTGGIGTFTLTGEWQYISYTTIRSPLNTATYSGGYVYLIPSANGDTLEVCGLKLERGNKATDWSPAPEDVDAKTNEAAKTATNFLNFNNSVLVIGDMTADVLGNNVLIDSDSVDIRNGNTIRASYGNTTTIGNTTGKHILVDSDSVDIKNGETVLSQFTDNAIYLGKNGSGSVIDFCNGSGFIKKWANGDYGDGFLITSSNNVYLYSDTLVRVASENLDTGKYSHILVDPSSIQIFSSTSENSKIDIISQKLNFVGAGIIKISTPEINIATSEINIAAGTISTNGTLVLSKTKDASGTADNSPALIVGGTSTQPHLEFDANEITAKSDETTSSSLWLNNNGGSVYIGNKGTGNLFGICQEVTQGVLGASAGATTTKTIKYKSGRTKVLIEMWTTGSSGYYNSEYETISSPMTAVDTTILTSVGSSVGKYSISSKGDITLYNVTPADAKTIGAIRYRVTHFN